VAKLDKLIGVDTYDVDVQVSGGYFVEWMSLTTEGPGEDERPRLDAGFVRGGEHETSKLAHAKLAAKVPGDADPRSQLGSGCPSGPCGSGSPRKPDWRHEERVQPPNTASF